MQSPFLSIIVPVRNGGDAFRRCLAALATAEFPDRELIVVDDGSTDSSAALAEQAGAIVLHTSGTRGPGAARNLGAQAARGEVLVFVDADCEVHRDTLSRMADAFSQDGGIAAAFGSYDADPPGGGVVSRFKNLHHHYIHQQGRPEAFTFWAGCGAIRRSVFLAHGGFNETLYARPSIEDIELGYRIVAGGGHIRLVKDVQVKHLKRWRLISMLRSDIEDRGIPWTRLILSRRTARADLNLRPHHRISGVLSVLLPALLVASVAAPAILLLVVAEIAVLVWLNRGILGFMARTGKLPVLAVFPLLLLYYLSASVAFALGILTHLLKPLPRTASALRRAGPAARDGS